MPLPSTYKPPKAIISDPIPPGTYKAIIKDVELLKDQPSYNNPEVKEDKYNFTFEVSDGPSKGRRAWLKTSTSVNAGYKGQPSWLYKIFCAAYYVYLTSDETNYIGVEAINSLIGKEVAISIINKDSNGKTYSNVKDVFQANISTTHNFDQIKDQIPLDELVIQDSVTHNDNDEITVEDIPF